MDKMLADLVPHKQERKKEKKGKEKDNFGEIWIAVKSTQDF
jgi:hypothetical protein